MRYSLEPREREETERLAWGGVGGLVVGAGPAEVGGCWWAGGGGTPTLLADRLERGVDADEDRRPWPMSSRAATSKECLHNISQLPMAHKADNDYQDSLLHRT